MSSYILTFSMFSVKKWIRYSLSGASLCVGLIFSFNFLVDPYNVTEYNLLQIKNKLARDDRVEKLNYFETLDKFDNIIIGSSRVYTIDPKAISRKLGGTTYNFGVGTASIEDHLGILLFLKKRNKLPKNLILGVDFYTFNKDTPPNPYFLKNSTLNFLSYDMKRNQSYWEKFLTIDAFRASFKTLKNHIFNNHNVSVFDELGWSARLFNDADRDMRQELLLAKKEIEQVKQMQYSNYKFNEIDPKRVKYYEKIRNICNENNITLYIFTTPLHPLLLEQLQKHESYKALNALNTYLSTYDNFYNFLLDKSFNSNLYNFRGALHTTSNAGYKIVDTIFSQKN